MIKYHNVHGDAKPKELELSPTILYKRSNIHEYTEKNGEEEHSGWEYDEEQYSLEEYFRQVVPNNENAVTELTTLIATMQEQMDSAITELTTLIAESQEGGNK